jgi:hypothetical protein
MIRLRATAPGRVEFSRVRHGGKGTTAPDVLFTYTVDGRRYDSNRFAPGWTQGCSRTGGGAAAAEYFDGQDVVVHYDPDRPYEACLAWGWSSTSLGLPFLIGGFCLRGWGSRSPGRGRRAARIAGWMLIPLGGLTLYTVPGVLAPSALPAAAGVAALAFAVSLGWHLWMDH